MNRLSQHIEFLLLTHNCVIVPQFGAFVALSSNAQHVDNEDLFFPPKRIVRFNPDITEDDGLLVGVVQAVKRCTLSEAKRQVQSMILELRQQLLADGQVDFGSIGIFTQDEDGKVSFSTCQAGIMSPEHYGLDAFTMPKLTTIERRGQLAESHKRDAEGFVDNKHIVIRINRRSLRYVAAAAAVLLICVLFSTPMSLQREKLLQQAALISTDHKKPVKVEVSSTEQPAPQASVEVKENAAEQVVEAQEATQETAEQEPVAAQYAIVLASDVSQKNAERYIADLQQRGYETAQIHDNGKIRRVVLAGYADETEAYNANVALHKASKEFASSWVMKL